MLSASERWKAAYPGASIGALAMRGAANPESSPQLGVRKQDLETLLRAQYASQTRSTLKGHPTLQRYAAYYKRFGKTYHVQLQLESVVFKGKPILRVAALVEAMFMAELKNLLLTAGHDLDAVQGRVAIDTATGGERYVMLSGQEQTLKPGDMFIHDERGVLSSVLYGPDSRTRITPATTRILFTAYAPPGIAAETVRKHLMDLKENVLAITPCAEVESLEVLSAG